MEIKNNRIINKVVTILTSDLDLIENNTDSDAYPYTIWVNKEKAETNQGELRTFLLDHEAEYNLLMSGEVDYIVIEYDI